MTIEATVKRSGTTLQGEVVKTAPTSDHNKLSNRNAENQHPISSISGLTEKLEQLFSHSSKTGNVHNATAADIGAAPAGYGLGGAIKDIAGSALNTTTGNGWYRIPNDSVTIGGFTHTDWFIHVKKYSTSYLVQEVYPVTAGRYKLVRWCTNDTWHEEWDNPPLEMGKEYRTTQRYNGKPVYVKALDLGTLPASGDKSVQYSNVAASVVSIDAFNISSSGTVYIFPTYNSSGTLVGTVSTSSYNFYVTAYSSMSARTGYAIVRYTKD